MTVPSSFPLVHTWHAGKRVAETLAFDYNREHGVEIRVVRIFNTYGPRMALDDGRVVSNFVKQAILDEPITVQVSMEVVLSWFLVNLRGSAQLCSLVYNILVNVIVTAFDLKH